MRKRYKLLKDNPEVKRGAIFEEECDNGDQGFHLITEEYLVFPKDQTQQGVRYGRNVVMKQPTWFEEVTAVYVPKSKLPAVRKLIK